MIYPLMGAMTFLYVFCKAFQQRNVVHNNWMLIPLFTFCMAVLEISAISLGVMDIADNGWDRIPYIAAANGIGGTLGCWGAMLLHNKYFAKRRY